MQLLHATTADSIVENSVFVVSRKTLIGKTIKSIKIYKTITQKLESMPTILGFKSRSEFHSSTAKIPRHNFSITI